MKDDDLQSRLTHAQKIEVVGLLAGGVAHDFNNLLSVILGQAGILLREALNGAQLKRVEAIHRAAERGASLTRKLLTFSRRGVIEPRVLDLNALIVDLSKMLRRLIREDVEIVTRFGVRPATICADPGQIEQVIINLAVNAQDAMPQGGVLTLETAVAGVDVVAEHSSGGGLTRELIVLTITDTGVGMTDEVKAHLFEPFFTTKAPGKGTGLGLATVHGIIGDSGGQISCESTVGWGTAFTIFLPRVSAEPTAIADPWFHGELPRGTETIMLVEDDGDIRELAREILSEQGFAVLDAADADAALQLSGRYPGPIHLLLTDVVMRGLDGHKLSEQLTAARPEMKVVYMSGHPDDVIARFGVLRGDVTVLRKPFTPLGLVRKVRETLDARGEVHSKVLRGTTVE